MSPIGCCPQGLEKGVLNVSCRNKDKFRVVVNILQQQRLARPCPAAHHKEVIVLDLSAKL